MRLGDRRTATRDDRAIPAEIAAELDALDAALRGDTVPEGMEALEALVDELGADRLTLEPEFGARLDAWAAAGFPRGERPGAADTPGGAGRSGGGLLSRLGSLEPRRWAPVAAAAATLVVVVAAVSQVSDLGGSGDEPGASQPIQATEEEPTAAGPEFGAQRSVEEAVDPAVQPDAGEGERLDDFLAGGDSRRGAVALNADSDRSRLGFNRGQERRKVERDAQLTLGAAPDEVPDVTNRAIDVVEGAGGVVLNSRLSGTEEMARATLELQLPSSDLDATLAELSDLGDVLSRSEGEVDITAPFVGAKDRLVGLRAERDNLAERIREAATDAEVDALQAQLAAVNESIARARTDLDRVGTRAQFAEVTVEITSEGVSAEDDWSLGDALDDAGRVLTVGAGIALISAAVLLPLALIAAIAYTVLSAANRRSRERALDK